MHAVFCWTWYDVEKNWHRPKRNYSSFSRDNKERYSVGNLTKRHFSNSNNLVMKSVLSVLKNSGKINNIFALTTDFLLLIKICLSGLLLFFGIWVAREAGLLITSGFADIRMVHSSNVTTSSLSLLRISNHRLPAASFRERWHKTVDTPTVSYLYCTQ